MAQVCIAPSVTHPLLLKIVVPAWDHEITYPDCLRILLYDGPIGLTAYQAGGGPAGLISALTLYANGVPFRIIDRRETFHEGIRGTALQVCGNCSWP